MAKTQRIVAVTVTVILIAIATGMMVLPAKAHDVCDPITMTTAEKKDIPRLLADAACFLKEGNNLTDRAEPRLERARELAAETDPLPTPDPEPPGDPEPPIDPVPPVDLGAVPIQGLPKVAPVGYEYSQEVLPKRLAPSNSPDVVGAFRFLCWPSHLAYDDPVVHPGQPGKSHLHDFSDNTMANAHSTYESL